MGHLDIRQIPVLSDNYVYLVHDEESGETAVVDPAAAAPVLVVLEETGWRLSHILNTHHHPDHVGGNHELVAKTGCTVVGFAGDAARIPDIGVPVREGDEISIGAHSARVFEVPGHTSGHIAYWFGDDRALFCGDTLFALGCGRLFEGTAEQMWHSLLKLRALPDDTQVYCAHEYTQSNARFALSVDPGNEALRRYAARVDALRAEGRATVPSLLGDEKMANPFLRADKSDMKQALGMEGAKDAEVFAGIRARKDNFRG